MSFPRSSNLVHLRAFTETLCDNPSLLEGRLFRRDGTLYTVTGIDARTGIARLSAESSRELGLAIVIFPNALTRLSIQCMYDFAVDFGRRGPAVENELMARLATHPVGNLHQFSGFDQIREWEAAFLPAEEQQKYAASVGHLPGGDAQARKS